FLVLLRLTRAWSELVRTVEVNPRLHLLQVVEHPRPVDDEVAHERELRHRLERDCLPLGPDLIPQRAAPPPPPPPHPPRARAAHLLQTHRLPDHRRDLRPVLGDRALLDLLQRADDVHLRLPRDLELFPAPRVSLVRSVLPPDLQLDDSFLGHRASLYIRL